MTTDHTADGALSPELEAIAAAAHDRLTRRPARTYPLSTRPGRRVAEAASAAIAAGAASARSPTPNATASCAPARSSAAKCCGR